MFYLAISFVCSFGTYVFTLTLNIALSHWCIFHRSKAELVVATWEKQFHSSDMVLKVPLLYLANDILQNSKRKGNEFVTEFWKVLPNALKEVANKGDDRGKKAVSRLVRFLRLLLEHKRIATLNIHPQPKMGFLFFKFQIKFEVKIWIFISYMCSVTVNEYQFSLSHRTASHNQVGLDS